MGCSSSRTIDPHLDPNNINQQGINIPFNEVIVNAEYRFRDFEDTDDDTFIGAGVKRIHNYKCDLPYDKLDYLRQQFWLTRNQSDDNWLILKQCCQGDEIIAKQLLEANHLICIEGNISKCYSMAQPSFIYRVPNFCICDPLYEIDYDQLEKNYDQINDDNINIIVNYNGENYNFKIRTKCTGYDLKYKIRKRIGINSIMKEMTLLYKGSEIIDYHCLYFYNVEENATFNLITRDKIIENDVKKRLRKTRKKRNENSYYSTRK